MSTIAKRGGWDSNKSKVGFALYEPDGSSGKTIRGEGENVRVL